MNEVAYITTSQVAEELGVTGSAVRRWVAEGKLRPAVTTAGGHYRFTREDLEAFKDAS